MIRKDDVLANYRREDEIHAKYLDKLETARDLCYKAIEEARAECEKVTEAARNILKETRCTIRTDRDAALSKIERENER